MYYQEDRDQLSMEEFFMPFGGRLRKDNRWVRLAGTMPWGYIEEIYIQYSAFWTSFGPQTFR